tara:strand:- start:68 stop:649 length:582 start_codon:yes stop_codon:yes gene_type:complete
MPNNKKTVRDLVAPADSAAIVDYLIDYFNKPDIPELYSEQVAGIPVKGVHGLFSKEGKAGSYDRTIDREGRVKHKEILLDTDKESGGYGPSKFDAEKHPEVVSKDVWYERTPRNTLLHEAFGHGMLDAVYGYQKKPHFSRTETFPYMLSVYSQILKMKREGVSEDDYIYRLHLDAFDELREMSGKQLNISKER